VGDIDMAEVDSLKALDPNRPIREADNGWGTPDPFQTTGAGWYDALS
jgi:hypothetical protein